MDLKKLHQDFVTCGKNAREWLRRCQQLLPLIDKWGVWKKEHFSSVYTYAFQLAGMNERQVDEALKVAEKLENKPLLKAVADEKGINRVKPILSMVNSENEAFWAEKANSMSKHELEIYAKHVRERGGAEDVDEKINDRNVEMILECDVADKLEQLSGGDFNSLMKKFLAVWQENLDAQKPEIVKSDSEYIPAVIRKYVLNRSCGRCEFPGCNKKYHDLHHADRWCLVKEHNPDRIFALCLEHHKLAHHGLIESEHLNVENWGVRFEPDVNLATWKVDEKVQFYRRV